MIFRDYKKDYEDKYNAELNKTGVFYAFSKEQFNQNKTKKDASDTEYISVGLGGYIHKSDTDKLDKFLNEIAPKLRADFISKVNIDDFIKYELVNYECSYTGDYTEVKKTDANFSKLYTLIDYNIEQANTLKDNLDELWKTLHKYINKNS